MTHAQPTPLCAAYETLLPLLTTDMLTSVETQDVLAHTATCDHCHRQLNEYAALEAAGRRYYGIGATAPSVLSPLTLNDILYADTADTKVRMRHDVPEGALMPSTMLTPQRIRRHRHTRLNLLAEIAAVLIVALLGATLLVNRPGVNGAPPTLGILPAGGNAVVFAHIVPWGRLEINGRPFTIIGHTTDLVDTNMRPFYLPYASNTITYTAAPFPTFRCTISAPASPRDTCPLKAIPLEVNESGTPVNQWSGLGSPFQGRQIDLKALPNLLPAAIRDALIAATQHQMDASTSTAQLSPGDHYLTANGTLATATRTFALTLSFHVPSADESIVVGNDVCTPLCPGSGISPISGAAASGYGVHWTVFPALHWDYTLPNGNHVTVLQKPIIGSPIDIVAKWSGTWQVRVAQTLEPDTLEEAANNQLSSRISAPFGISSVNLSTTPADGELLTVIYSNTKSDTLDQTAYVLYRAGALVAVDSASHQALPWIPVASAHELAIARQLGSK